MKFKKKILYFSCCIALKTTKQKLNQFLSKTTLQKFFPKEYNQGKTNNREVQKVWNGME